MPVIGVGRTIDIIFEHGNGRDFWMVLIDRMWHVNLAKVLGELDMLLRRHLLISKKDNLVCDECFVHSLCAIGCDMTEIDIDFCAQGWSETFNLHGCFPAF